MLTRNPTRAILDVEWPKLKKIDLKGIGSWDESWYVSYHTNLYLPPWKLSDITSVAAFQRTFKLTPIIQQD